MDYDARVRISDLADALLDVGNVDTAAVLAELRALLGPSDGFTFEEEKDKPVAFIQWKGTNVCLDFVCTCGANNHFDGDFAYVLRCSCGLEWEMPYYLYPRAYTGSGQPTRNLGEHG